MLIIAEVNLEGGPFHFLLFSLKLLIYINISLPIFIIAYFKIIKVTCTYTDNINKNGWENE